MLQRLVLHQVGPRGDIGLDPVAPRLNLITGDNGLGKSFLLEAAWWALTRTWNGLPAMPHAPDARIVHHFDTQQGKRATTDSVWDPVGQFWKRTQGRPANPGLVMYARVDGSFSVWDPLRNYRLYARTTGGEAESPHAYQFTPEEVLWGLKRKVSEGGREREETLCLGLVDEWREWQRTKDSAQFGLLTRVLAALGPEDQPLVPGELRYATPDEQRAVPTVRMPYGEDVPILYAPAGVLRMSKLAYLLTWVLSAHEREAQAQRRAPSRQVILLVDEPETHLHPRWQRTVLRSLMEVMTAWHDGSVPQVQLLVTTHSPLVLASAEPRFDPTRDALWKLDLVEGRVRVERDQWRRRGDVAAWLTSDVFDLDDARSREAERALADARALVLRDAVTPEEIHAVSDRLRGVLSDTDRYWLRWSQFAAQHGVEL